MEQLELDAAKAKQLLEQRNRVFIEDRLLVSQWCDALVKSYTSATDDIRSKLPPLGYYGGADAPLAVCERSERLGC